MDGLSIQYLISVFMFSVKLIKMFIYGYLRPSPNSACTTCTTGVDACSNADKKAASASNLKQNDPNVQMFHVQESVTDLHPLLLQQVLFSHHSVSVPSSVIYLLYLESFLLHPSPSALTVLAFLNDHVSFVGGL